MKPGMVIVRFLRDLVTTIFNAFAVHYCALLVEIVFFDFVKSAFIKKPFDQSFGITLSKSSSEEVFASLINSFFEQNDLFTS